MLKNSALVCIKPQHIPFKKNPALACQVNGEGSGGQSLEWWTLMVDTVKRGAPTTSYGRHNAYSTRINLCVQRIDMTKRPMGELENIDFRLYSA